AGLSASAPKQAVQGASIAVTLTGSNFVAGASIQMSGSGVSASNVTVISATQINATFTVASNAATGSRNVTVLTAGGTSSAVSFTVTAPSTKPTLTSLTPNAGSKGTTVNVTLWGTNFVSPLTVAVQGGGVTVSNVEVVNSTTVTATFRIRQSATRSARNTTVTTSAGTSNALTFTVR